MQKYKVRDGVERVNGKRVPDSRIVELSDAEAKYELAMQKIEPVETKKNKAKSDTQNALIEG